MAGTATNGRTQQRTVDVRNPNELMKSADFAKVLQDAIDHTPTSAKRAGMERTLSSARDILLKGMPRELHRSIDRVIQVAAIYYGTKPELWEATPESFARCVMRAATAGMMLDGRLCYAVVFNNKQSDGQWKKEAQFMFDWKGLLSVAKRARAVSDATVDAVWTNDRFEWWTDDSGTHVRHYPTLDGDLGQLRGVYTQVFHQHGCHREYMSLPSVLDVRAKSKAKDSGPWRIENRNNEPYYSNDFVQMAKKTVLRRALNFFADDPSFLLAISADDEDAPADMSLEAAGITPRFDAEDRARKPIIPQTERSSDPGPLEPVNGDSVEPSSEIPGEIQYPGDQAPPLALAHYHLRRSNTLRAMDKWEADWKPVLQPDEWAVVEAEAAERRRMIATAGV